MTNKKEVVALLGDYDWKQMRMLMMELLSRCENEIDFMEFIESIVNSTGTPKQIKKIRKELGIKDFSEKEKKLMEKFK